MKNILKYSVVALAALSLVACNQKESTSPEVSGGHVYTIAIDGGTKAVLGGDHMVWETGDLIGWFTDQAGHTAVNMDADPRTFNVSSAAALEAGALVYAYAPYKAGEQSENAAPLSIPVSQSADIDDAMPMVSLPIELKVPMEASDETPAGQASFINLGAVIEYNVFTTGSYGSEKVQSVTFAASSAIAGNFTVDLTSVSEEDIPAISGIDQKTVTSTLASAATVGAGKANGLKVYQVVAPGSYDGTITVTTDAATYEYTLPSTAFGRAKIKTVNLDLASEGATRQTLLTDAEKILVGSKWLLSNYYESWADDHITDQYNVMADGGSSSINLLEPRLVFNPDHSFSLDHFHYYKDVNDYPGSIPSDANGEWALNSDGSILTFSEGAFPIVLVNNYPADSEWDVISLTASELHIVIKNAGQWVNLVFIPAGVEANWSHAFSTGDFGLTDENIWSDPLTSTFDGKTWTLSNDQGAYKIVTPFNWSGTVIWNGWNWAYEPTLVTLTSSSYSGSIKSVSLDFTIGQNWEITANCSIGGAAFGDADQHFTNTSGDTPRQTVTFSGSASGTITITVTQPAETGVPIMLRGVHVTYIPE